MPELRAAEVAEMMEAMKAARRRDYDAEAEGGRIAGRAPPGPAVRPEVTTVGASNRRRGVLRPSLIARAGNFTLELLDPLCEILHLRVMTLAGRLGTRRRRAL